MTKYVLRRLCNASKAPTLSSLLITLVMKFSS